MSGIIVDVVLAIIILGNAILGYKKGLASILFSLISLVLAIVLVFVLYKPVSNYVFNNTSLNEKFENIIRDNLERKFENTSDEEEIEVKETGVFSTLVEGKSEEVIRGTKSKVINDLSITVSKKVIQIAVFIALFLVIRLILFVIKNSISAIVDLPIINVVDGAGGMIYGLVKGFLIIYIILAILSFILPLFSNNIVLEAINNSKLGNIMFNKNVLLNLIIK